MHVGKQGTLADQLAEHAESQQHQGKARAHHEAIHRRGQHRVLRGKGIGPAEDDAVGDDQRDEDAENQEQLVGIGLHQQFDTGGDRSNDHDEGGQAHGVGYRMADQRYRDIGHHQHQNGGDAQPEGVDCAAAYPQQGTQAQQLHQSRVVVPQAVGGQFRVALVSHGWPPDQSVAAARRGAAGSTAGHCVPPVPPPWE